MLQSTYETFASQRKRLQEYVRNLKGADFTPFRKEWVEEGVEGQKARVGAEDGSFNYKGYKSLVLYALNAACVHYGDRLWIEESSDIDFLYPYRFVRERLSLYMATLEIKTALKHLENLELLLLDGSLYTMLVAPRELFSLDRKRRRDIEGYLPEIEKSGVEIASKRLAGEEKLELDEVFYLEYLEYLYSLSALLEKGLDRVVGISKTSSDTKPGLDIPYMAGFEEVSSREGYSRVYESHVERRFPLYNEFFHSMVFNRFYARLENNRQILLFEVPREIDIEELRGILARVGYFSIEGYPYLLRKAHSQVVIGNKDIDSFASLIGIKEKTGREYLR